jgi:plasmid stabilization system protein ParE
MPASKKYRFHPLAWQEVEAAEAWYRQRSHEASARFLSEIYDALENLARSPQRWPSYQYGTRRFVLHQFPFSVIYRDEPAAVSIVAIAHHKRRPGYWKDRA